MDFQRTASHAPVPVRDAELPASDAVYPCSDADALDAPEALDALEARITELWGHINAATAQFLALLAEFDRREGWAHHGLSSCAHWLNWQCGISRVAAREKVRTARALASLPKITARAAASGRRRPAVVFEGARAHASGDGGDGRLAAAHRLERHGGACGAHGAWIPAGATRQGA